MTIEILTTQQNKPIMLDIDNASLGFFLWRHVTRMFEVTPLEDVQASNW